MKKRNVLHSPRLQELKKKRRKTLLVKFIFFGVGFLVVLAGLAYISRTEKLNISEVEITGNKIVDTEMIRAAAQEEITGSYLWFLPKTNILLYPKGNIRDALSDKFKGLKGISITTRDDRILQISVAERIPKYMWCGENLPESGANIETCYFLDETGFVFDEAPYFSGEVYFKFYGKMSSNFKSLILFKQTLEAMKLEPVALYMMENGEIKMYLSDESSLPMGPEIIFKTDSDLEKIAENLQAALTTEPLQSDFKNKYSSLLYIDLRYGNKVYYKFK